MTLPAMAANAWLRWDVVERLVPDQAGTVLEIGCGQGAVGTRLAVRHDYLGVEPDPASYATAAKRMATSERGEVRNGRFEAVVEPGRTFDLVCAFEVLEHLEHDAEALAQWVERVRPGGWLLLSTPAFSSRFGPFDEIVGHYRRYEPSQMSALLAAAGLVDVQVTVYGAGLGEVLEAARNFLGRRRLRAAAEAGRAGQSHPTGDGTAAPAADQMAEMTGASGRLLQPPNAMGSAVRLATAPFRLAQRRFPHRGTGLVARGRKPDA